MAVPLGRGIGEAHRAGEVAGLVDLDDGEARMLLVVGAEAAIPRAAALGAGERRQRPVAGLEVLQGAPPVDRVVRHQGLHHAVLGAALGIVDAAVLLDDLGRHQAETGLAERGGLAEEEIRCGLARYAVVHALLPRRIITRSVQDEAETHQVEQVEGAGERCIGFEEFPDEALQAVPADREIEAVLQPEGVAGHETLDQHDEHRGHGERFVELHGVAWNAVAEIDGPGNTGRRAVGEVGEAGEEAAQPADGHGGGEGRGEDDAGRALDTGEALEGLDRGDGAGDAAHHGEAQRVHPGKQRIGRAEEHRAAQRAGAGGDGVEAGMGHAIGGQRLSRNEMTRRPPEHRHRGQPRRDVEDGVDVGQARSSSCWGRATPVARLCRCIGRSRHWSGARPAMTTSSDHPAPSRAA